MRAAVFLDRDGVINERRLFLVRKDAHFALRPDALRAIARLSASEYAIVVATNQPAVGWGFLTHADLDAIHARMRRSIVAAGGRIDRIEVAPFGPFENPPRRKPNPGMLLDAASALDLDLARSWMVGDTGKDVAAGRAAGCRTILVNPSLTARLRGVQALADSTVPTLSDAVEVILHRSRHEAP